MLDEDEFARNLIPELFKHNNYASFVRQLNMYGFHKKVGLSDNSMRASERKNKSPSEYANPYFRRGHPDLLWLIQKPKHTVPKSSKAGHARVKTEDSDEHEVDDVAEEMQPQDEQYRARQLSLVANNSGSPLPRDQLAGVYREVQAIRQQQQVISNTITKLRREHEQLYTQAANFQEQHTRHENSINAILTFLATVYNRSLQGQDGAQNLANAFAGVISQDRGGGGNIVDVGDDYSLSPLNTTTTSAAGSPNVQRPPGRKQPLLLKAPPISSESSNRGSTLSPASTTNMDSPQLRPHVQQPSAGHVEELFDNSPQQLDHQQQEQQQQQTDQFPSRDIMSAIQDSNAQTGASPNFTDFPNVLSSLGASGGQLPLTPNQRDDMLRLMANETDPTSTTSAANNNALAAPPPVAPPMMPQNYPGRLANTRAEINNLAQMQADQDRSVQNLTYLLQPLSPSGVIPGIANGVANGNNYNNTNGNVPPSSPLDLDQIFNNDYFADVNDEEKPDLGIGTSPRQAVQQPQQQAQTQTRNESTSTAGLDNPNDMFDFDHLSDSELFGSGQQQSPQQQKQKQDQDQDQEQTRSKKRKLEPSNG